ncbi:MAG: hypothetical protein IKG85_02420 [Clostridia bacterium]|nr:hypothetical protein [Clostridia bacterium]
MSNVKEMIEKVGQEIDELGRTVANSEVTRKIEQAGADVGKAIVETVKKGIRAVNEWANDDASEKKQPEPAEQPESSPKEGERPASAPEESAADEPEKKYEIIYD